MHIRYLQHQIVSKKYGYQIFILPNSQEIIMQEYYPLLQNRQTYQSKSQITLIVLNLTLSTFHNGYCLANFGQIDFAEIRTRYKFLESYFHINDDAASAVLNGCIPVGAIAGALISSYLIRKLSRRKFLLVWNTIALIAAGCIYIPNFFTLLIFRILQGTCVGAFNAIIHLMIRELAPTQISGKLGSYAQFSLASGMFLSCALNLLIAETTSSEYYWLITFGVPGLIVLVQTLVLLFVFPYETPRYLMSVGREQEARKLIEIIYKEQYVDQIFMQKTADMIVIGVPRNIEAQASVSYSSSSESRFSNKMPFIVAIQLAVLKQFSGSKAVAIYGGLLGDNRFLFAASIFNLVQVVATFASSYLLLKFGRKSLIQFGTFSLGLINFAMAVVFGEQYPDIMGLIILVYMAIFGLTLGPIIWFYISEIVQDRLVPWTSAINAACTSLVIILLPILTSINHYTEPNYQRLSIIFFAFTAWCFGSFAFNWKYLIQSKDKTFRDMQYQYYGLKIC